MWDATTTRSTWPTRSEPSTRCWQEGPLLPPDLLVSRSGLPEATVQTVRTTFQQNFPDLLAALLDGKDNAKYDGAALVDVTDADYDVVRSMYRAIGANDFTEFVGG